MLSRLNALLLILTVSCLDDLEELDSEGEEGGGDQYTTEDEESAVVSSHTLGGSTASDIRFQGLDSEDETEEGTYLDLFIGLMMGFLLSFTMLFFWVVFIPFTCRCWWWEIRLTDLFLYNSFQTSRYLRERSLGFWQASVVIYPLV